MDNYKIEDIDKIVQSVTELAKANVKNAKEIAVQLHQLLKNAPGRTAKKRKEFIVKKFPGNGISNSYLRRMLHAAEFEMVNELEPGTLKEFQVRLILAHTNDSELRLDILKRALEIADTKKLTATHVKQAIGELEASLLKHKKPADSENDSDQVERPTMEIGSTTKPVKEPKSKQNADDSDSPDNGCDDDTDPFGIDEARAQEVQTRKLFQKLKPHFESDHDRIAAIRILGGSKHVWAICKAFSEYNKDEIDDEALIDLIDPDKDLRKVSKNGSRKQGTKRKINKSRSRTQR